MSILTGLGLKLLAGLAIAGAVVAVLMGARRAGRTAEKVEQTQRNSEIRRRQDAVEKPDSHDVDAILGRL
jgi:hypothetical protein